jgi:hypothetical protein
MQTMRTCLPMSCLRMSCLRMSWMPMSWMPMSWIMLLLCIFGGPHLAGAQPLNSVKPVAPMSHSSEPIKRIDIYVLPYYESAKTATGNPTVAVGKAVDKLLSSNKQEDILAVRDSIRANAGSITPMTLMVLAIRLYDVGLRDEAVLWFYAAKDRFITLSEVVDVTAPSLAQANDAMHSFVTLAGPVINSYAFCNIQKQQEQSIAAVDWVEKNPYQAIFMQQLPAKPGDRASNLKAAITLLRANAQKEHDYFADPKNLAEFNDKRAKNNVPAQFCWN